MELEGVQGAMKAKSISFSLERCWNTTENNNHCHSFEEISDYIEVLAVDYWVIQNKMDLTKFDQRPVTKEMKILG